MPRVWDNPAIKAELERRGYTLTGLAKVRGLHESACRRALHSSCLSGALAIADALGVTVQELWPGRYIRRPAQTGTTMHRTASPKCDVATDTTAAA